MDKAALALIIPLLQYPEGRGEIFRQTAQEAASLTDSEVSKNLLAFLQACEAFQTDELAANYVSTFDFNEQTSLYLTALLFGDERKRIDVLTALKNIYLKSGLALDETELPDYLPALLEFCCAAEESKAKEALQLVQGAIELLYQRLAEAKSFYKELFAALVIALEQTDTTLPVGGVL
ncbi:MAG: nitrate reductase molybdenum cofactor assembly chaperone [Sporomusaceae bacterium]|nr:nitrate reductase molybdenum cofactor assembly chaperone [Sporomusaceae bacterium]